jgi:hypothetical protein
MMCLRNLSVWICVENLSENIRQDSGVSFFSQFLCFFHSFETVLWWGPRPLCPYFFTLTERDYPQRHIASELIQHRSRTEKLPVILMGEFVMSVQSVRCQVCINGELWELGCKFAVVMMTVMLIMIMIMMIIIIIIGLKPKWAMASFGLCSYRLCTSASILQFLLTISNCC